MGSNAANAAAKAEAETEKKEDSSNASVVSASEWADGVNTYFTGVAASVSHQFAKDSGFAFVERFAGSTEHSLDAKKELDDLGVACKMLHSGSADPGTIWREWLKKLTQEPPLDFYDILTDDHVTFQRLLLRSPALEATLGCILRSPEVTKEEGDVILDVLDRMLMGEKSQKQRLLKELCALSQNVDGTASHDQIERLVCEAVKQAKRDLGYEEALQEAAHLGRQVREREEELRVLPEVDVAALEGDPDGGVGDDELKVRVSRSAELLDRNASMRHLTTVARSMMEKRKTESGVLEGLKGEIHQLKNAAANECAGVKQQSEGTQQDKLAIKVEAVESEQRLTETESVLATRLDELLDRKRKLEEELEEVLGSILSTDQKLNETRRELSAVNRNAAAREKSLAERLQALSVQTQDYENELDALDEVGGFVELVQGFVATAVDGQLQHVQGQREEVVRDQLTFVLIHLQNQAAQLQLLRSCILFCHDELEATRARSSKINKLGIQKMVSEEGERQRLLEEKYKEAEDRVLAIEQDASDIRAQVKALAVSGPGGGSDADTLAQLTQQIEEATKHLDSLLGQVKALPALSGEPSQQGARPALTLNTSPAVLSQSATRTALSPEPARAGAAGPASPPIPPQFSVQELLRDSVSVDASTSPGMDASASPGMAASAGSGAAGQTEEDVEDLDPDEEDRKSVV